MLLQTFLLLSCFLAFSSALTADLTKSFLFFTPFNDFVPQLINTENGVLAYSVETTVTASAISYFPQYLHIDIESTNVTQILNDTMTACGHGKAIFDRMYYHTATSTLVYYCTGNNTLLILDHHDYTVQGAIPVNNVNDTFNETRLSAEGNSIVILGMGTPYSSNITATQLIKINLQTKQVIRHVTFEKGLDSTETVVAYVSQGLVSYILTNKVENGTNLVNIYSAIFVANIYTLKLFTSFNYIYDTYVATLNDLFYVGDYVVSHNNESLLFFDKSGEVAYNYSGIAFNKISWTAQPYTQRSSIVMPPLTSVIYALFANNTIAELSFNGSAINSDFIASGSDMHVATGDQSVNDLLFTLDKNNFNITDLQTLNLAYSVPTYFDIFYSKSHYCLVQGASVQTFDIATDDLIAQSNITSLYYYESSTQTLYFTQQDTNSCLLLFYNIETLESGEVHSFHDYNACSGTIIDLEPSNPGNYSSVQLTIWTRGDFIIVSNTLGEASMRVSELSTQVLVVQYDTLTAYQLLSQGVLTPDMALNKYLFNKKTRNFHLEATSDLTNQPVEFGIDFTVIDNETVGVSYNNAFTKINVSDGSVLEYNVSTVTESTSSFYDAAGQIYLILSGDNFENPGNAVPSLFSPDNQLSPLPMTDNFTIYAGGAGYCHYWVAEGFISGLQLMRVKNICPQEELMTIIS